VIRLYTYWRSSAAYRVRLALNLKGLEYESVPVSLVPGVSEHRADEYREKNPQMLVPFLEDGDIAVGQSQAILEYLDEAYPDLPLIPASEPLRSKVRAFANGICCDIHPLNNLRVLLYLTSELGVSDEQRNTWYSHWIHEGFRAAEAIANGYADSGPYTFGDRLTIADCCLVPQVYNARRFAVPLDEFPRLVSIDSACRTLPAFVAAAPEKQPDWGE
jgi:maleylacetoacetate isomerase